MEDNVSIDVKNMKVGLGIKKRYNDMFQECFGSSNNEDSE